MSLNARLSNNWSIDSFSESSNFFLWYELISTEFCNYSLPFYIVFKKRGVSKFWINLRNPYNYLLNVSFSWESKFLKWNISLSIFFLRGPTFSFSGSVPRHSTVLRKYTGINDIPTGPFFYSLHQLYRRILSC